MTIRLEKAGIRERDGIGAIPITDFMVQVFGRIMKTPLNNG